MPAPDIHTLVNYAQQLNLSSGRTDLPALIFMTDDQRVPDPERAIRNLPPGSAVIFRDYNVPDRRALGRKLIACCASASLKFLVAGNGALAEELGADGLHMPEHQIAAIPEWRTKHHRWIITCAAHSATALAKAARAGAHAALLSPVFPTASHPETMGRGDTGTLGSKKFNDLSNNSPLPVYALGGVTARNAPVISGQNTIGLAAIGALSKE